MYQKCLNRTFNKQASIEFSISLLTDELTNGLSGTRITSSAPARRFMFMDIGYTDLIKSNKTPSGYTSHIIDICYPRGKQGCYMDNNL